MARIGLVLQPEIGHQPRRPRQKQRLDLSGAQAGELGLITFEQAPAAARSALGHHRHARAAQGIHVAENGALGNLQALGQVAGWDPPMHLQQKKDGKQPVGAHG